MHEQKSRKTDGCAHQTRRDSGSNKREWSTESHNAQDRKYIRTQSSSNNRVVSSSNGKDTKKPIRVVGDWSEFQSSTGKTYFYNRKTEVSQWERPKGWPKDDVPSSQRSSSSSTDRNRKSGESSNRTRPTVDEGTTTMSTATTTVVTAETSEPLQQSATETVPQQQQQQSSPNDDNSRMSFSSTSSKESSSVPPVNGKGSVNNDHGTKSVPPADRANPPSTEPESINRDYEIQKYYRAELIAHLTSWSSNPLEKQCFKLFDDYYRYSAKCSTTWTELKGLKSHHRVLEIKRNILAQRLLRCEQRNKERDEDTKPV